MESLKHAFTSAKADGADATLVRPSNWNAQHDFGQSLTNRTGVTLAVGDAVALSTANDESVVLVDTLGSLRDFVVALGTPADLAVGIFAQAGVHTVKNQGAVTRGNYLQKSATTRAVEDMGAAITSKAPQGAVGFALTGNAGSGTVIAYLFGHTVQPDLNETQATRNLALNGDQEDWRNGTSVAAFGWTLVGAGATIARDGTNKVTGSFAANVTRVTNDCQYERDCIAEAGGQAFIRSKEYTFHARIRATVPDRARLRVNDGVGSSFSSYHNGDSAFQVKSVTRALDSLATALKVGLQIDTGDTSAQIDTIMVTQGNRLVAFQLRGETSVFRQVFTSSGTYTKPSNLIAARVIAQGPGGNGGGPVVTGHVGAGGGAGAYSESMLTAADIGVTETVTVPAGGSATAASFGALVTANAGAVGGQGGADQTGGAGGAAGTGQVALAGASGENATVGGPELGGDGASSSFGGRGAGAKRSGTNNNVGGGAAKANTGSGGGGGLGNVGTTGTGGSAIVIVQETLVL